MPSATPAWDRKHLLALEGLAADDLIELLDLAEIFREAASGGGGSANGRAKPLDDLSGRTIGNLFFEDSTRTRCSFTIAAMRLGANTIDITNFGSSVSKGETIVDTAMNMQAMGVHGFVVRSSASGAAAMIARAVRPGVPVINAGDGRHEHPTQGLLDLLTLRQRVGGQQKSLRNKTIAIVGDIVSSRVARSAIHGLTTLGANVILVGPPTLAPKAFEQIAAGPGTVSVSHDLDDVLPTLDAIMMLRVQFERASEMSSANPSNAHQGSSSRSIIANDYRQLYGLNAARADRLPPHAVVLHPGPMNRGLEIDSEVADDAKRSVILQQVTNGVAVRMAVLKMLFGDK